MKLKCHSLLPQFGMIFALAFLCMACNASDEPTSNALADFAAHEFPLVLQPPFGSPSYAYVRYTRLGSPEKKEARHQTDLEDALYLAYKVDLVLKVKEDCSYNSDFFREDGLRLTSYCTPLREMKTQVNTGSVKKVGQEIVEHGYVILAKWDRAITPQKWQFILKKR